MSLLIKKLSLLCCSFGKERLWICFQMIYYISYFHVFHAFNFLTGNEDAGMHGDVDADEKERDDILREQVHVVINPHTCSNI